MGASRPLSVMGASRPLSVMGASLLARCRAPGPALMSACAPLPPDPTPNPQHTHPRASRALPPRTIASPSACPSRTRSQLSGEVPGSWDLPRLQTLDLSGNNLGGGLPPGLPEGQSRLRSLGLGQVRLRCAALLAAGGWCPQAGGWCPQGLVCSRSSCRRPVPSPVIMQNPGIGGELPPEWLAPGAFPALQTL